MQPRSELGPPAHRLAAAAASPSPSPSQSRFVPRPDWPSPQSQSFSRSYRSNLPTSLTYIVLSTRGCAPWRPAADMGTAWHEIHTVSVGFSRADRDAPDTARAAVLYGPRAPISGQADSRGWSPYKEKRTLPGVSTDVSHFVCVAALGPEGPLSVSRFGNINPIPFRSNESTHYYMTKQQCSDSERTSPIS